MTRIHRLTCFDSAPDLLLPLQQGFLAQLTWQHQVFLAEAAAASVARGGSAVPGVLERAWEHYMATRTVPPQVERWNSTHPASELPGYNPVEAVDEAIMINAKQQQQE